MARLRDLRNTLLSRMTISSGLADAADAAASSIVSGCDDDMNERYIDFFTPFTALVMAPFLPKPRGHSPEDSSSALSEDLSASLSESARRARARPRVEPRARSARGRVVRRGAQDDAHRARGRARRRRTPRRRERARPSNLLEHGRVLTPAVSFVRRDGDARSGARRAPIVLRLTVQSQPTMPAWRQSAKDLSRTKSVARRRVIARVPRIFFPVREPRNTTHSSIPMPPQSHFSDPRAGTMHFYCRGQLPRRFAKRREKSTAPAARAGRWNDPIRVCTPSL